MKNLKHNYVKSAIRATSSNGISKYISLWLMNSGNRELIHGYYHPSYKDDEGNYYKADWNETYDDNYPDLLYSLDDVEEFIKNKRINLKKNKLNDPIDSSHWDLSLHAWQIFYKDLKKAINAGKIN